MDIEFHYYITHILAEKAGFSSEDAQIIAYASQYVDDNNQQYTIDKDKPDEYQNYISQTLNILKPKHELIRIHPCFHFLPGDYCYHGELMKRKDGLLHILTTTPNSKNVNKLMDAALQSANLYQIGIATHCYADTWAHQNFVGYEHRFNSMRGLLENVIPDIGHADAGHKPDIVNRIWYDKRLVPGNREIHNKERFLEAAKHLFDKYSRYVDRKIKSRDIEKAWSELKRKLGRAIGKEDRASSGGRAKRSEKYLSLAKSLKKYRKDTWFKRAIKTGGLLGDIYLKRSNFYNSHWYKFQQAVKEHQKTAMVLLKPAFEQIGFTEMPDF